MASGKWNHTAELLAAQINLSKVMSFSTAGNIKFVSAADVHPYYEPPYIDPLEREFITRFREISTRLPRAERAEARRKLAEEYRSAKSVEQNHDCDDGHENR